MSLLSDKTDPDNLIKGETLDLTRIWTWFAAGLGVVGPSIFVLFKDIQDGNESAVIGAAAAVMVATVIGIAIAISADLRARSAVTAAEKLKDAQLAASWRENVQSAMTQLLESPSILTQGPVSENGAAPSGSSPAGALMSSVPMGGLVGVKLKNEGADMFILLTARYNAKKKMAEYLVARSGAKPEWKLQSDVESVAYPYVESKDKESAKSSS